MLDTNTFTVWGILPYYFFAGVGLVFAFGFFILYIAFQGIKVHRNAIILFLSFIGLILGAVFFGFLTKLFSALYQKIPLDDVFDNGVGIVFYGGLTGFVTSFLILQRISNKTIEKTILNTFTVAIPLFHTFARVGCFFAGCCYGKELDTLISVAYIIPGSSEARTIFPVQLVEATLNILLFGVLLYLLIKYPHKRLLPIYLSSYASYRFLLEFLRGDPARGVFGFFSFSQIYSVLIILTLLIIKIRRVWKDEST